MFGIRYLKAPPTTYVMHYAAGRLRREGPGLSFFYWEPTSHLVAVRLASQDAPFIFEEVTADFQAITVQGQLTYRVTDATRLAELFDLSVDPELRYLTDDHEKLEERLVHTAQILSRAHTQARSLSEALSSSDALTEEVRAGLRSAETVKALGVEILDVAILAVRPTPETSKALEAEAREGLQRRSDEAIYARRNAAVEAERKIRESEMSTQIAVEEKKRQIRETQMAAEISVEQARATLIDSRVANDRKDADSKAYALEQTLGKVQDIDWRKLLVLGGDHGDPRGMIALAFQQLAENATKIGTLNISPELLQSLASARGEE